MQLKQAITRVCRFCGGKESGILRSVRLVPAEKGVLAKLWATDGKTGCLIQVDEGVDLPGVAIGGAWLAAAVKGSSDRISFVTKGYGQVEVAVGESVMTTTGEGVAEFPPVPIPPELRPVSGFKGVVDVSAFAASPKMGAQYAAVRLREDCAEATDTFGVARADMDLGGDGQLVPARLFKHWGKGPVEMGFDASWGYFRVGDELRVALLERGGYPDLERLVPERDGAPWLVVDRKALKEAVVKAQAQSPRNLVRFCWSKAGLVVSSWMGETAGTAKTDLELLDQREVGDCALMVSGRPVARALDMFKTPAVRLSQRWEKGPIRLESGPYTVCVWPFLPVAGGDNGGD
jgi:hypothetical protein